MPTLLESPAIPSVNSSPSNGIENGLAGWTADGIPRKQNGQFVTGWKGGPGRPAGIRNAQTAYMKAAPKLAKAYITRAARSDSICIDARRWIYPSDAEVLPTGETHLHLTTVNLTAAPAELARAILARLAVRRLPSVGGSLQTQPSVIRSDGESPKT